MLEEFVGAFYLGMEVEILPIKNIEKMKVAYREGLSGVI